MLTFHQIALVRAGFDQVRLSSDTVAAMFYARLFEIAPDTRRLFTSSLTEQGRKLMLTLATVVDLLDRPEALRSAARALALRHVGYGTQDRHYDAVGLALCDTLRARLGARFDAPAEAAWTAAYALIAETMIGAAREAPRGRDDRGGSPQPAS